MKRICLYCDFIKFLQSSASETEELKKNLEESEAEKAKLRELMAQQDNDLLLAGQQQSLLQTEATQATESSAKANSRILGLEAELKAL